MVKTFSKNERTIANTLSKGTTFVFEGEQYTVTKVAKPQVPSGECKTDIYIAASNIYGVTREFKISYKQENAQFIENKMKDSRAESLLGSDWKSIIESGTKNLKSKFESRAVIIKKKPRNGSITLGWKYELLDVKSGELSSKLNLSKEQIIDVYSGENLPEEKRNAVVDGIKIENSGVANYMLRTDKLNNPQDIINNLQTIEEYVEMHPDVYFACKALNYRTFDKKYDGDRPLAVQIDWENENGFLVPRYNYSDPLTRKGKEISQKLLATLDSLGITDTNGINSTNFLNQELISE
jgi:hypothetical protein